MIHNINHCVLFSTLLKVLDLRTVCMPPKMCINIRTKLH